MRVMLVGLATTWRQFGEIGEFVGDIVEVIGVGEDALTVNEEEEGGGALRG